MTREELIAELEKLAEEYEKSGYGCEPIYTEHDSGFYEGREMAYNTVADDLRDLVQRAKSTETEVE